MSRKTVAILILAGGILTAFFIVRALATPKGDGGQLTLSVSGSADPAFAFGDSGLTLGNLLGNVENANFTERVAQRYGEEILKLNPPRGAMSGIALPPEGTVESLIAETLERPLTFKTYTTRDLRTVPLKDKEGLARYFVTLAQIQTERFGSVSDFLLTAVARFIAENERGSLEKHRDATTAYVGDLLTVPVPTPLVPFHLGLVNLWQKRASLATYILKSGDDPLKVVAAVDSLEATASEEDALLAILASSVKSLNL